MTLPIPPAVLYAGLGGVFLSLVVATATNGWQLRVFFLLALRLAIGWHFLFEGLHKLHSFVVGPTDTNKVFTSEPFHAVGEGPLAGVMRERYLADPVGTYTALLTKKEQITAADFRKKSEAEKAALCPDAAAKLIDGSQDAAIAQVEAEKAAAESDRAKAAAETVTVKDGKPVTNEAAKAKAAKAEAAVKDCDERLKRYAELKANSFAAQKAKFAAWVYGDGRDEKTRALETRDAKLNMVTGDVPLTAEQRLSAVALLQREFDSLTARESAGLGRGNGLEIERKKKLKADLQKAQTELAADADKFLAELRKEAGLSDPAKGEKPIVWLDHMTAWMITVVGAGLLLGLFTKVWLVVGAVFLVMTYLENPTRPWLSLPPGTEGNPLFINKNLIEALAMLAVMVHPTGRWLGLDALLWRLIFGDKPPLNPPAAKA